MSLNKGNNYKKKQVDETKRLTEHQKLHERDFPDKQTSPCSTASTGGCGEFTDNWKVKPLISIIPFKRH